MTISNIKVETVNDKTVISFDLDGASAAMVFCKLPVVDPDVHYEAFQDHAVCSYSRQLTQKEIDSVLAVLQ
jgi:hypothetical protein